MIDIKNMSLDIRVNGCGSIDRDVLSKTLVSRPSSVAAERLRSVVSYGASQVVRRLRYRTDYPKSRFCTERPKFRSNKISRSHVLIVLL